MSNWGEVWRNVLSAPFAALVIALMFTPVWLPLLGVYFWHETGNWLYGLPFMVLWGWVGVAIFLLAAFGPWFGLALMGWHFYTTAGRLFKVYGDPGTGTLRISYWQFVKKCFGSNE